MANTYSFGQIGNKIGIAKVMDNDMNITASSDPNQASAFAGGSLDNKIMHTPDSTDLGIVAPKLDM